MIDNSSHVTIEGLTFFATTFKAVDGLLCTSSSWKIGV